MANSTLRLSEQDEKTLIQIAELVGTKGKNETIQKMIETYCQLKKELDNTEKILFRKMKERNEAIQKIDNFKKALSEL